MNISLSIIMRNTFMVIVLYTFYELLFPLIGEGIQKIDFCGVVSYSMKRVQLTKIYSNSVAYRNHSLFCLISVLLCKCPNKLESKLFYALVLLVFVTWATAINNLGYIFIGASMKHTCRVPEGLHTNASLGDNTTATITYVPGK